MRSKIISVILGGGAGTRLYPLTHMRSKPAVPIGGKYRLIDIPISNCLNFGLKRMFVLTQYNSASLNRHIKNTYHFDNFGKGFVDILAAEQTPTSAEWFQGTADAVRQCMHHLENHDYEYLLILSGDQLYQMDLEAFTSYHIAQNADLSVATIPVDASDAPGFGIMKVSKDGFIDRFVEKPAKKLLPDWKSPVSKENKKKGKEYLASMGIYIFNKAIIGDLLEKYEEAIDFGKEIIPNAIKTGFKVASYSFDGYWTDIGTIRSFFDANLELCENVPDFNLFGNEKIVFTRARMLPGSKFFGTKMVKAVLSEGVISHAKKIERSIIGIRSRIGKKTVINRSVIFGNDYYESLEEVVAREKIPMGIGDDCQIENAILDKNCRIGNKVIIRGDDSLTDVREDTYCIIDGIVVVRKGAVIPDGSVIGLAKEKTKRLKPVKT